MKLSSIKKPTLLIDEKKCRINISAMAQKARLSDLIFRPHFKTHQSLEIGQWFRDEKVESITASSVTMAKFFADAGWKDITVAFPINIREIDEIAALSKKIKLNILISDPQQAEFLSSKPELKISAFVKIDTGNHRSGFFWNEREQIVRILDYVKHNTTIRIEGFLTHSGHTYKAKTKAEVIEIYKDTLSKLSSLKDLSSENFLLSSGDTPACSLVNDFKGLDEIRPGNFVFYDLMQYFIGSCDLDQVAVAVACPVVEKNLRRNEIIIYGGGVHLSKDSTKTSDGNIVYGKAVLLDENGWYPASDTDFVRSISQEHGIISPSPELFNSVKSGSLIAIIPVHSCMTADLLRSYHTFDEKILNHFSPK